MTRVFDAPRHLVYEAHTKPELVKRWLGVEFDDRWYEGEAVGTMTFSEKSGKTTFRQTMLYATQQVRDAVLASPMETGVGASYDKLAELLQARAA